MKPLTQLAIAAKSDEDALNALLTECYAFGYRHADSISRVDSDVVVSKFVLKVWRSLSTWEPGNFRGWLWRVWKNNLIDYFRKQQRRREKLDVVPPDQFRSPRNTEQEVTQKEREEILWQLIAQLPGKQGAALEAQFREQMSRKEIACLLDTTEDSVRGLLYRGRRNLEAEIIAFCDGDI